MPVITIDDPVKYGKAVDLLLRQGGAVQTRPTHALLVSFRQLETLIRQGLASPFDKDDSNRGTKKTRNG